MWTDQFRHPTAQSRKDLRLCYSIFLTLFGIKGMVNYYFALIIKSNFSPLSIFETCSICLSMQTMRENESNQPNYTTKTPITSTLYHTYIDTLKCDLWIAIAFFNYASQPASHHSYYVTRTEKLKLAAVILVLCPPVRRVFKHIK